MRFIFGASLLFLMAVGFGASTPALAITGTDRQQVCFAYCEKNYNNAPPCRTTCGQLLSTCMTTGCWESKITAKQCGISRQ